LYSEPDLIAFLKGSEKKIRAEYDSFIPGSGIKINVIGIMKKLMFYTKTYASNISKCGDEKEQNPSVKITNRSSRLFASALSLI